MSGSIFGPSGILKLVVVLLGAIFVSLSIRFGDLPWETESCNPDASGCPDKWFSVSWLEARQKFRVMAKAAGAELSAKTVHTDARTGQEYTMDFAVLKGSDPSKVLVHLSGTHGVEGYAGSAIQHKLLSEIKEKKDGAGLTPTVIFVHAVNPTGMALNRRFNHNNVDLNRNCLTEKQWAEVATRHPNVARYEDMKALLNPSYPPTVSNILYHFVQLPAMILEHGYVAAKRAIVSGQYHDQSGVYYGGSEREENLKVLDAFLQPFKAEAKQVVFVDVHSGLGPSGKDTLLIDNVEEYNAVKAMVGDTKLVECAKCAFEGADNDAHSGYELMVGGTDAAVYFPDAKTITICEEFGTIPGILVATSVIYENAANNHVPHTSIHERAGRWTRNAFYVPKLQWKNDVLSNGLSLFWSAAAYMNRQ